jgi:hypothetical protein
VHREPGLIGHLRDWHRTRKRLLREQPLSGKTEPRSTRLTGAPLDDDLSPVGKPNTNNLVELADS